MNRRLPRFALLVVLLVTMLGITQGGGVSPNLVRAQDDPCSVHPEATPQHDFTIQAWGTPQTDEEGIHVLSVFSVPDGLNVPGSKSLLEIELDQGAILAVYSQSSTILRVNEGSVVTLTVCSGVAYYQGKDSDNPIPVEGGSDPVTIGDQGETAIYVEPGNFYYLTGVSGPQGAVPSGAQQLDYELANNELPAASLAGGGSSITVATGWSFMLCGSTRCV